MASIQVEIRRGTYYDSIVLLQLQKSLSSLPDVLDVGVVMGTEANKALLRQIELLPEEAQKATNDDLIVVVKAKDEEGAKKAIEKIPEFLTSRGIASEDYIPKSLPSACKAMPDANWVLVSVPGRYAARVAHDALDLGKHVFLYSDNVSIEEEIALKTKASSRGLLVLGPDCGTAIVNQVGLGFANQVRKGNIGIVAASGTGLQTVACAIHRMGMGISQALGTGGRDLSQKVGAITTQQALELLQRDPETKVIVLISKPPAPEVTERVLRLAKATEKPVIVDFIGYHSTNPQMGNVHFTSSLEDTARLAVALAQSNIQLPPCLYPKNFAHGQRYLRGLFSGGTLAYEALHILQSYFPIHSNICLDNSLPLKNIQSSEGHTILDLGEDEFTVGRLHPMLDNSLRIRRMEQEARDPEVAIILLDVVLGYGTHPDPATELAKAISHCHEIAKQNNRVLEIIALVIGTEEDPQVFSSQVQKLQKSGARIETSNSSAIAYAGRLAQILDRTLEFPPLDLSILQNPLVAINVGLSIFFQSLCIQKAPVIQVDWKPPASGNEKLMGILEKMKQKYPSH